MMMKPRIITNNATRPHTNKREHTENVLALFFVFKSTKHLSRVKNRKKVKFTQHLSRVKNQKKVSFKNFLSMGSFTLSLCRAMT